MSPDERREKKRAARKAWYKTAAGRECRRREKQRARQRPAYKAKKRAYKKRRWADPVRRAQWMTPRKIELNRAAWRRYNTTPKGREMRWQWARTPKGREMRWLWVRTPVGREQRWRHERRRSGYGMFFPPVKLDVLCRSLGIKNILTPKE